MFAHIDYNHGSFCVRKALLGVYNSYVNKGQSVMACNFSKKRNTNTHSGNPLLKHSNTITIIFMIEFEF